MSSPLVKTTPSLLSCQAVRLYVPLYFSFSADASSSVIAEVWTDLRTTYAGGQGWQAVALEALHDDFGSAIAVVFPTVAGHYEATFRYRLASDAADAWLWSNGLGANAIIDVLPPLPLAHALLPNPTPELLEELASQNTTAARMLSAKKPIFRELLDQVRLVQARFCDEEGIDATLARTCCSRLYLNSAFYPTVRLKRGLLPL
jgi:hypothetical protein